MLSRRGIYTTAKGTHLRRLRSMGPYNIELNSIKLALKTPDLKKSRGFLCYDVTVLLRQRQLQRRAATIASNKMTIQSIYLEDSDGP